MIINPHIFSVADSIAPTIPGGITFTLTDSRGYIVNWGASTDDSGSVEYELYIDGVLSSITTNLSYEIRYSSALYFEHLWKVRAKDASGNVSAFTPELGWASLPIAPTITAGIITDASITNAWNSPTGAVSYEYEYKLVSSGTWLDVADDTSPSTVSLLNSSTFYDFRVRAFNSYNQPSLWSIVVTVSTSEFVPGDTTPPTVPTSITALSYPEQPWANVQVSGGTDAGSGVSHYEVWRSVDSFNYTYQGDTTFDGVNESYLDNTTVYNRVYYYKAITVDNAGNKSAMSTVEDMFFPTNK